MIEVPPLLAGMIRHGLDSRVGGATVTELAAAEHAGARLRELDSDVVIIGPTARPHDAARIRMILPHAQVLTVSPDLTQLIDLDTGERERFTPDALAERLRR